MSLILLRNATVDRLKAVGFAGAIASRNLPTDVDDLPSYRVYVRKEDGAAEGAANHGPPSFVRDVTVGISVMDFDEDGVGGNVDTILTSLFESNAWLALTEGVLSYEVEYFDRSNGEDVVIEAQIEIQVRLGRIDYEPTPDDWTGADIHLQRFGTEDSDNDGVNDARYTVENETD